MRSRKALFGLLLLFAGTEAAAQSLAVGVKAGSLGLGLEGILPLGDSLQLRVGVNAFDYDFDDSHNDIDYDYELGLRSWSALLDWHPGEGGFRLSGGLVLNDNEVEAVGTTDESFTLGGTTYSGAAVGALVGNIGFNEAAPYLGLGWGRTFRADSAFALQFDLGVLFQGEPDVELRGTGPVTALPGFEEDLASEIAELEDDFEDFRYYPVVSLGFTWSF